MASMNSESAEDDLEYPRDIELIRAKEYPMLEGWATLSQMSTQLTDQKFYRDNLS